MALATQQLFGLDFVSEATIDDVVDDLLGAEATGWSCVVTPNVDHIVRYRRSPADRAVADDATTVLPDGMPIVWAARLLKRPLRDRLTGSDLFAALWPRVAAEGIPIVVIASRDAVAERLAAEHPGAAFVVPPLFSVDAVDDVRRIVDDVVAACDDTGARFVVVGVSMDKHHHLAARLHERWGDAPGRPTVMLLGASADMYLGDHRRAPRWMQRAGLEWLHRLALEPRRMARRYLVDDPTFAADVWREWRAQRRSGGPEGSV